MERKWHMYRDIIDGQKLRALLPDLPEELHVEKIEVFMRPYSEESEMLEDLLQKIKKRVLQSQFLGKEKEVFFFSLDELPEDLKKPLQSKLKETGFGVDMKEGARHTVVLTVSWRNS